MITGQMTKTEMVEHYGVSRQSIYCWLRRWEEQLREESRQQSEK